MSDTEGVQKDLWTLNAVSVVYRCLILVEVYLTALDMQYAWLEWTIPADTYKIAFETLRLVVVMVAYRWAVHSGPPGLKRTTRLGLTGCVAGLLHFFVGVLNDCILCYSTRNVSALNTFNIYAAVALCSATSSCLYDVYKDNT